jgi:hypothetical protein
VMNVIVGIVFDALLCFGDEVIAITELRCSCRACIGTGRLVAIGNTIRAHVAFSNQGKRLVPFVFRNEKRTRQHAIAATHAFGGVVGYRTCLSFREGTNRAYGNATGILTIHAEAPHVFVVLVQDDCEFVFGLLRFSCDRIVIRKAIPFRAAFFAQFTVNAESCVVENSFAHYCSLGATFIP